MYALGAIAFIVVLAWLVIPPGDWDRPRPERIDTRETPFERQLRLGTERALTVCKPYSAVENVNDITTGLALKLSGVAVNGKPSRKRIEDAIDGRLSEPGKLHEADAARDCMVKEIADTLDRGGFVSKVSAVMAPSQQVLIDPKTGTAARGYVYVEELNGEATLAGPFVPEGSSKALPYA